MARRQRAGILFALPALTLTVLFFFVPLAGTVWTSLHNWPLYGTHRFIGLRNYGTALTDTVFWSSIWFTCRFMFVTLTVGTALSFGLALMVSQPRRGVGLFRTAVFLPVTMGYAAAGFLWYYLLDGKIGVINDLLITLDVTTEPVKWLADVRTSFWAVALMTVWKSMGFAMVIFLIGIQAIPGELFEAFKVDGAGRVQTLRRLTIPMLRNNFALVLVLGVVGGMLTFDQFFTMTKGGPRGETVTAVYQIYATAFDYQKLGYGSALSVILLAMLAIVSALQLTVFKERR